VVTTFAASSGLSHPATGRARKAGAWPLHQALVGRRSSNDDGLRIHQGLQEEPIRFPLLPPAAPLGFAGARGTACHWLEASPSRPHWRTAQACCNSWVASRRNAGFQHHAKRHWPGLASIPGWRTMLLKARQVGELPLAVNWRPCLDGRDPCRCRKLGC